MSQNRGCGDVINKEVDLRRNFYRQQIEQISRVLSDLLDLVPYSDDRSRQNRNQENVYHHEAIELPES